MPKQCHDTVYDTFANRPAFGVRGRLFVASDTLVQYLDTGAAWIVIGDIVSVAAANAALAQISPYARLTLSTGLPAPTTDVTAAGTLYYCPSQDGLNQGAASLIGAIAIFDAATARWYMRQFAQKSLALVLTAGKNYDVFVRWTAGAVALALSAAWTNDTTRADALTGQDGVLVLGSDPSYRWVGTIRASGANVCEDSVSKRYVWNAYCQLPRELLVVEATASWTTSTAVFRASNGAATNAFSYVSGDSSTLLEAEAQTIAQGAGAAGIPGIGVDSTTVSSADLAAENDSAATQAQPTRCAAKVSPGLGYHLITWLEKTNGAATTFFGTAGVATLGGMQGKILA